MKRSSTWLLDYQQNIHSQTGEDGIISKVLELIPENDKWCVEFGAWDGLYLTNTRNLIDSKGYSAVLIEADKTKFLELKNNYSQNDRVTTLNKLVGFTEKDNLDQILESTTIPYDFDLLSIDIDGNDYHTWKAVEKYRPKVVVIEFNPTIPTQIQFIQPADPSINQGSSLLSLVELGKAKGYELVSVLEFNAFFVRKEFYPIFQIESNAPEVLRTNLSAITYFFSGYDGRIFLRGNCMLPWHGVELNELKMQYIPSFLRIFGGNYTKLHRKVLGLYLLVTEPNRLIKKVKRRFARLAGRLPRS